MPPVLPPTVGLGVPAHLALAPRAVLPPGGEVAGAVERGACGRRSGRWRDRSLAASLATGWGDTDRGSPADPGVIDVERGVFVEDRECPRRQEEDVVTAGTCVEESRGSFGRTGRNQADAAAADEGGRRARRVSRATAHAFRLVLVYVPLPV